MIVFMGGARRIHRVRDPDAAHPDERFHAAMTRWPSARQTTGAEGLFSVGEAARPALALHARPRRARRCSSCAASWASASLSHLEREASDVRATRAEITNTIDAIGAWRADHDRDLPGLAGRPGLRRLPVRAASRRVGPPSARELPGPQGPARFRRIERRRRRRAARARPRGVTPTRRDSTKEKQMRTVQKCQREASAPGAPPRAA